MWQIVTMWVVVVVLAAWLRPDATTSPPVSTGTGSGTRSFAAAAGGRARRFRSHAG